MCVYHWNWKRSVGAVRDLDLCILYTYVHVCVTVGVSVCILCLLYNNVRREVMQQEEVSM